jgi:hypothetical protein
MESNTNTTNNTTPVKVSTETDITALLNQLKSIESDRETLLQQVQQMQAKIGKLTEGKKQEMQKALDTVINDWLTASVDDEQVRDEFKKGMSRLVDQTAEESGVWRVVCCASNVYAQKLRELETIKSEMEHLKKDGSGRFTEDQNRKRPRDDEPEQQTERNIWDDFAEQMKGRQFIPSL